MTALSVSTPGKGDFVGLFSNKANVRSGWLVPDKAASAHPEVTCLICHLPRGYWVMAHRSLTSTSGLSLQRFQISAGDDRLTTVTLTVRSWTCPSRRSADVHGQQPSPLLGATTAIVGLRTVWMKLFLTPWQWRWSPASSMDLSGRWTAPRRILSQRSLLLTRKCRWPWRCTWKVFTENRAVNIVTCGSL